MIMIVVIMTGHQDNSPSNHHKGNKPYWQLLVGPTTRTSKSDKLVFGPCPGNLRSQGISSDEDINLVFVRLISAVGMVLVRIWMVTMLLKTEVLFMLFCGFLSFMNYILKNENS